MTGDPESPAPPVRQPAPLGAPEPPLLEAERVPRAQRPLSRRAVRAAWAVAIAVDAIQWIFWPLFAEGAASPAQDVLDVVAAGVLIRLLGWHWYFLPGFLAELVPGVDLVPTWTAAVFFATRGRKPPKG